MFNEQSNNNSKINNSFFKYYIKNKQNLEF